MSKIEYDVDPGDHLRREIVGNWVEEKHRLLASYVNAARAARERFGGSPCLVDLYSGPGRVKFRGTEVVRDGGTLAALRMSFQPPSGRPAPFVGAFIADKDAANVEACNARLVDFNIPVTSIVGKAEDTVVEIASKLPPHGLHIAFLDPYAIAALPMSVVRHLARVRNVDLVIHFASGDLKRNLENPAQIARFEAVAPGWTKLVSQCSKHELRRRFFRHWSALVHDCGYHLAARPFRVRNSKGSEIYMLTLASKHPLGPKIWDSLRPHPQRDLL